MMQSIRLKTVWLAAGLLILGFLSGWAVSGFSTQNFPQNPLGSGPVRSKGDFAYINPLLFCAVSENKEFEECKPLEETIEWYIQEKLSQKSAKNISVYYREIDSGRWFGVNENEMYTPASLYKVPIMIAYLKIAEKKPNILTKKFHFDGTFNLNVRDIFSSGGSNSKEYVVHRRRTFAHDDCSLGQQCHAAALARS